MQTLRITPVRAALRRWLVSVVCALSLFGLVSANAQDAKRSYSIPADTAEKTLKQFSEQSGRGLIAATDAVKGIRTNAVAGELTAEDALELLLAETGLIATRDAKNGSFVVRRGAVDPNVERALAKKSTSRPSRNNEHDEPVIVLDEYEVTGSRLRGLDGVATPQPVFIYTREDLDRFGATTIAELQRYIPQLPQADWNRQLETSFSSNPLAGNGNLGYTNIEAGLRALGGTSTLVLVDGRRIPKLGQRFSGQNGAHYDLGGIPLSAIERIEVVTDGASAIYGSDAIAGVVNIILKKNYRGTEVSATYSNTFETDTGSTQLQISHGIRARNFTLSLSTNWTQSNSLAPRDRWWSATNDKRPWGGTDGRSSIPGGQGGVSSTNGAPLPGLTTSTAGIPLSSTGQNLTIADFAATPLPDRFDSAQYTVYGSRSSYGASVDVGYRIAPPVELFARANWRRTKTESPTALIPFGTNITTRIELPANYPGNPFGVPIFLNRAFYEILPLTDRVFDVRSGSVTLGFRGAVGQTWKYEGAASTRWTRYGASGYTVSTGGAGNIYPQIRARVATTDAAQQIILLNNALAHTPHPAEYYIPLLTPSTFGESPDLWTYDFRANGDAFQIPGGIVAAAFGGELNREKAMFDNSASTLQRLGGSFERENLGVFAELQAPLLTPRLERSLGKASINLALRYDRFSDFGAKINPRVSLLWNFSEQLALRGSYGEGFLAPSLHNLYQPQFVGTGVYEDFTDPGRNQFYPGITMIDTAGGGNPTLGAERSESVNCGILLKPSGFKGLTFSLDAFSVTHFDRVSFPQLEDILVYFPERITRAAPTPADVAAGLPGELTFIDGRAVNMAYQKARGFDAEARYVYEHAGFGRFDLRVIGSKSTRIVARSAPSAPERDATRESPWRATNYLFWTRKALEIGAIATFTSSYLHTATNVEVADTWLVDLQASLQFPERESGRWNKIYAGSRISVSVFNVANREPQTLRGSSLGNIDPRGRRYQLSIRKKF